MGATSNGMGGAATPQTSPTNLQNLFSSNGPVQSAQLPQITAPARPAMPSMPGPAQLPQQAQAPGATPFGDMSFAQRIGLMMGGRMDPASGKMNLPSGLDRGSAIAARNLSKSAVLNGQQNPFGRNPFSPQGGSR